jgi:hypothetical protein
MPARSVVLAVTAAAIVVAAGAVVAATTGTTGEDVVPPDHASGSAPVPFDGDDGFDGEAGDDPPASGGAEEGEPAVGGAFAMWARGGLTAEVAERAAKLPEVESAAFVRSDTAGLLGSRDADGRVVDDLADGFRIPVSVVAVEPAAYAGNLTSPEARDMVAALRPGEVLLSDVAAELRDVGVGGELDLDGRAGLRVAGVLPAGSFSRTEVIAHLDDADAIGLRAGGSIVGRHVVDATTDGEALAAALEALAPEDAPARVVGLGADADRRSVPLVLSLVETKERFGEFAYRPRDGVREIDIDPAFVDEHIVSESVPLLGTVQCHTGIMDDLRAALDEIVDAGLSDWVDPARYGGCFYPRRISPDRDRLSSHSWGISIDINVDLSLPGLGPVPPDEVIEIFGRHGFRWGGDFLQPDNHHYEWLGDAAVHRPDR